MSELLRGRHRHGNILSTIFSSRSRLSRNIEAGEFVVYIYDARLEPVPLGRGLYNIPVHRSDAAKTKIAERAGERRLGDASRGAYHDTRPGDRATACAVATRPLKVYRRRARRQNLAYPNDAVNTPIAAQDRNYLFREPERLRLEYVGPRYWQHDVFLLWKLCEIFYR